MPDATVLLTYYHHCVREEDNKVDTMDVTILCELLSSFFLSSLSLRHHYQQSLNNCFSRKIFFISSIIAGINRRLEIFLNRVTICLPSPSTQRQLRRLTTTETVTTDVVAIGGRGSSTDLAVNMDAPTYYE